MIYKIRCSGKLHRVLFNGKSWHVPDCDEKTQAMNALREKKSSCMNFMQLIRTRKRFHSHWNEFLSSTNARLCLKEIGIGNLDLVEAVKRWCDTIEKQVARRRVEAPKALSIDERWQRVIGDKLGVLLGLGHIPVSAFSRSEGSLEISSRGLELRIPHSFRLPIKIAIMGIGDASVMILDSNNKVLELFLVERNLWQERPLEKDYFVRCVGAREICHVSFRFTYDKTKPGSWEVNKMCKGTFCPEFRVAVEKRDVLHVQNLFKKHDISLEGTFFKSVKASFGDENVQD